jgi:hypothetical protein
VTSAIVKAYPPLNISESTVTFVGGNVTVPNAVDNPSSTGQGANASVSFPAIIKDLENFWRGVNMVYAFGKDMVDGGGTTYSYISKTGNKTFSFTTTLDIPRMSKPDIFKFVQPLVDSLNAIGIAVNNTTPTSSTR